MVERIGGTRRARARATGPRRLALALLLAACASVLWVSSASALSVLYNNFNTVAATVNGHANEDTFSEAFAGTGNTSIGGMVGFSTEGAELRRLSTQVDSFRCQYGVYYFENCRSRENKKFEYTLIAKIYAVKGTEERGSLLGESSQEFKIPYRPTTNVSCPGTGEGKGFGANCDVGGVLGSVTFRHFSGVTLPKKAIIEITTPIEDVDVNLGLEESYKEYDVATEEYVGLLGSGAPETGTQPLANDAFLTGVAHTGYAGAQPVFKVEGRPPHM